MHKVQIQYAIQYAIPMQYKIQYAQSVYIYFAALFKRSTNFYEERIHL